MGGDVSPPHSGSTKSCIWAVLAILEHFGMVSDPEEVVQINSPPHATCYLESILMYLLTYYKEVDWNS